MWNSNENLKRLSRRKWCFFGNEDVEIGGARTKSDDGGSGGKAGEAERDGERELEGGCGIVGGGNSRRRHTTACGGGSQR